MLRKEYLIEFKRITEERWDRQTLDPNIYGFQFQCGTRWNPGLADEFITEYENCLGIKFPYDFKIFLATMNGTNYPMVNIYGGSHEPSYGPGPYSYPENMDLIIQLMKNAKNDPVELLQTMVKQGFNLSPETNFIPIFAHRYLLSTENLNESIVLSIADPSDAIVYGNSLQEYLEREFL